MVLFALSCFGLLLFLWLSFGGPIPLKPKGYQFKVAFPEATQLGLEADVRVAGVIGRQGARRRRSTRPRQPHDRDDRARLQVRADAQGRPRDPAPEDAARRDLRRADARPARAAGTIPEGGMLADAQVKPTVELDEIFQALDPRTRQAFQDWQQDAGEGDPRPRPGPQRRARATCPRSPTTPPTCCEVLDDQSSDCSALVRNTGVVFGALTQDEGQLHDLIVNSGRRFAATSRRRTRRWPRRSRSSRRSSTSRSSRSRAWRRSRRTPTR